MGKIYPWCPDCGVKEGELHSEYCDWEKCSCCGKQVLAWGRCKGTKPEPFLSTIGFSCERCGEYMPDMKMISDKEWKFICGGTYDSDCILCILCMEKIKEWRKEK